MFACLFCFFSAAAAVIFNVYVEVNVYIYFQFGNAGFQHNSVVCIYFCYLYAQCSWLHTQLLWSSEKFIACREMVVIVWAVQNTVKAILHNDTKAAVRNDICHIARQAYRPTGSLRTENYHELVYFFNFQQEVTWCNFC